MLAVATYDHCVLRISAAANAFRRQVDAVVKSRIPFRLDENELVQNGLTVSGAIDEEIRPTALEIDEEVFVLRMTAIHEVFERAHRAPDLFTAHRAGGIEDDADAGRSVFIAEVGDFLLPVVIKDREVVLAETRDETAVRIGNRHIDSDQIGIGDQRMLLINLAGPLLGFWCR